MKKIQRRISTYSNVPRCLDNRRNEHEVIRTYLFDDEEKISVNQQTSAKVSKPISQPKVSTATQQKCLPKNSSNTNKRTVASLHTYNIFSNDNVKRIKILENKLSEANAKNHKLTEENRLLKTQEKRYEHALSVHEGLHAKLPQIFESHKEEIRTLKNQIRQMKTSFTEMENRYKSQTNELLVLRKQRTQFPSLPNEEELGDINKLNDQLKEAYDIIEQQKNEIQNFNHRYNSDLAKMIEAKHYCDNIENLGMTANQLNARRNSVKRNTEDFIRITRCIAKSTYCVHDKVNQTDRTVKPTKVTFKPKLPCKNHEDKKKPNKTRAKWNKY